MSEALVARAREIATVNHAGQVDKANDAYINHVARVAAVARDNSWRHEVIAWLHDVVEDTDVTLDDLAQEFDAGIVASVDAISHRKNEPNVDYIDRAMADPEAWEVKSYDLMDHIIRLDFVTDDDVRERLSLKYKLIFDHIWSRLQERTHD